MDYCLDTEEYFGEATPQNVARPPSQVCRYPAMYQVLVRRHARYVLRLFWYGLGKRKHWCVEIRVLTLFSTDTRHRASTYTRDGFSF